MKTSSTALWITGLLLFSAANSTRAEDKKEKPYEFKIEKIKAQPTMTIRFRERADQLSKEYGEVFGAVFGHVAANGGQLMGGPFGHYLSMKDGIFEVEAGTPVAKAIQGTDTIKASELPTGTVVTTIHNGPYEELGKAHEAIHRWAKENGHKEVGGIWEYYLTDPGQEPDQSKWQTKLYLPIAVKDDKKPK